MVRTEGNCPFSPGSDTVPGIWAGRAAELSDWHDRLLPRRREGIDERGRTVLGEAGIGKSALTARIAAEAEADGHLVLPAVRVPRGVSAVELLAEAVAAGADQVGLGVDRRAGGWLARVRQVSAAGVSVAVERPAGGPLHRAVFHGIVELARVAASDGRVLLVRVDEVQNTGVEDLSQLLVALGDALAATHQTVDAAGTPHTRTLPIAVYLTALPEFTDIATAEAGATFGRRFAPLTLRPLEDADLRHALSLFIGEGWPVATDDGSVPVVATSEAIERLLHHVLGDPFLFQLAGQRAWEAAPDPVITADHVDEGWATAVPEARRHVSRMLDRVPDRERAVLEAMAALDADERTAGRIAAELGYETSAKIGSATRRLEDVRGLIERGRDGYTFVSRTVEAYLTGTWP